MTPARRGFPAEAVRPALVLVALLLLGHYVLASGFGVYSDDIFGVVPALDHGFADALARMQKHLLGLRFQGRPLTNFMPQLLSATGASLGGLPGIYALGAAIFCLLALTLFSLVRRVWGTRLAFAATAVFVFFPADLNKVYLMHSFIHWPSLLLCLAALHLYVSRRRVPAFLVATLCLFYYEPGFLPFFAAPLLRPGGEPLSRREIARHAALCLGILGCVFALRLFGGDFRMTGAHGMTSGGGASGLVRMGLKSGMNMVLGPLTSLASYPYALLHLAGHATPGAAAAVAGGTALAALGFAGLPRGADAPYKARLHLGGEALSVRAELDSTLLDAGLIRALWVGAAMLCVSYLLSFSSFPATHLVGRETREHYAAGFAMALFGGAALTLALNFLTRRWGRWPAALACGLAVGLLAGSFFQVQREYVRNWQDKRWLWRSITALAPDAGEDTRIFIVDEGLPKESRPIASLRGWEIPVYPKYLFRYPEGWNTPPRAFVVKPDWAGGLEMRDGAPHWHVPTASWWSYWEPLPEDNLIILEMRGGKLVRKQGSVLIPGGEFRLKTPGPAREFPPLPLYEYLVR